MNKHSATRHHENCATCDRSYCIRFYKSENCPFCDMAEQILIESIADYGIIREQILEIELEEHVNDEKYDFPGLPAIEICDSYILGIPQSDNIADLVSRMLHKVCFAKAKNLR